MKESSIVDVLIENIKTDQELLTQAEKQIEKAKDEKRTISDRLKDYRKDFAVLLKYADEKQHTKMKELGFDVEESQNGLNPVASTALDIIMKAKGNQLTNAELYNSYVATFKSEEDAVNYTEFNIKCRSLFNTQRLLRKKGSDPKSSRKDIISLNDRVIQTDKTTKNDTKTSK